jgi:hypothetical protein
MSYRCLLLLAPLACGQTLQITGASGVPRQEISVEITYDGPSRGGPAALRWDMTFPGQLIEPSGAGPQAGRVARDAGKSLVCALRKDYSYTCVLSGGQQTLPKGPIAMFHFKIRDGARTGLSTFRVSHATGATVELKELPIPDAEAKLEVR